MGLEILQDLIDVDAVVVPVSGGGLLGGVSLVLSESLSLEIGGAYGVQSENLAAMEGCLSIKDTRSQLNHVKPAVTDSPPSSWRPGTF